MLLYLPMQSYSSLLPALGGCQFVLAFKNNLKCSDISIPMIWYFYNWHSLDNNFGGIITQPPSEQGLNLDQLGCNKIILEPR